jgi:hypothetical protein
LFAFFAFCFAGSRTLGLKVDNRGENEKERKGKLFETLELVYSADSIEMRSMDILWQLNNDMGNYTNGLK